MSRSKEERNLEIAGMAAYRVDHHGITLLLIGYNCLLLQLLLLLLLLLLLFSIIIQYH